MSKIDIRQVSDDEFPLWDAAVEASPHASLFHTTPWLRIVEACSGSKLHLYAGYIGNELVGIVPFFERTRMGFRGMHSPIGSFMISNLGPLMPQYENLKQEKREYIYREFIQEMDATISKTIRADIVTIITPSDIVDARPLLWNGYEVKPMYCYRADISDIQMRWDGLKRELRKNIKDAEKKGVSVVEGGQEEYWFVIHSVANRLGAQKEDYDVPQEYWEALYRAFAPDRLKVFVARRGEELLSGIIALAYRDTVSIWVGASQVEMRGLYPVDLLQWKIVEWAHEHGFSHCEIHGANIPSISYFKARYNFDLAIYFAARKERSLRKIGRGLFNAVGNKI